VALQWLFFHRFSSVATQETWTNAKPALAQSQPLACKWPRNGRLAVLRRLDSVPNLAHYAPMSVALKMKRSLANAIRERMAAENLNITTFARKSKTGRNSIRLHPAPAPTPNRGFIPALNGRVFAPPPDKWRDGRDSNPSPSKRFPLGCSLRHRFSGSSVAHFSANSPSGESFI